MCAFRPRTGRYRCWPHRVPCAALKCPAYPCPNLAGGIGTNQELSIIIPTLNAEATLSITLAALRAASAAEIVLSDGGSSDDTIAIARSAGARVVSAPRGRGSQLAAGADAASGAWLLFLHADCVPELGWSTAVAGFAGRPDAENLAGYFDFALDDDDRAARRLERIVAWRCRILGLPYGDQGLLISRKLYNAVGRFAPLPLMEDVDLVRRLGRHRLARIGTRCVASARRYRSGGYYRRQLRNLLCLSLYFAGVAPQRIARIYG